MSEQFKPVLVQDETGPYDQVLGHVEIHDDAGVFAGYDPTPVQVLEVCKSLGMSYTQYKLVCYATEGFHDELIDSAYWDSRAEEPEVRKLVGIRLRDMLARDTTNYRQMRSTRNFTPEAEAELRLPMDKTSEGPTTQEPIQTTDTAEEMK